MKMIELQAGLWMGVKKFRLIWVFENTGDLDHFINSGWEFGGQATVAALASGEGGCFGRSHVHFTRGLALPVDRRWTGSGAYSKRHQVLQG